MRFASGFLVFLATSLGAVLCAWCQSSQQVLLVPARSISNGAFQFNVSAPLGRTYQITATTNLSSLRLFASNIVSDTVSIVDPNVSHTAGRFFQGSVYWTVNLANPYPYYSTGAGVDGRLIAYPTIISAWTTNQGRDGRLIAYPPGWSTNEGPDGRLIAFPTGWTNAVGADGRMVAFPTNGFSTVAGPDGRLLVYPTPGLPGAGLNSYVSADWKSTNGDDGRQVVYPVSNFPTNQGADGRLVAFVSSNFATVRGLDARIVAYPATGYATNEGVAGRTIAYPSSSWSVAQGRDGRPIAYPAINTPTLQLDFENQQLFALLGHLRSVLGDTDFANYIIYRYFGTGDERFAD
jgi:hypothetical protein